MSSTTSSTSSTGKLSSLGIGSNGTLNSDTLDKLRSVDEAAQVTPIDTKLKTNSTQQTDLSSLQTSANTLKSYVNDLADETNYLARSTSVSNSDISVTTSKGTGVQDFNIHVKTLAKQDVYQTTPFATSTDTLTSTSDTLKMKINGQESSFSITSSTTLSDLKDMINDKLSGTATASIINTGGTKPYKLVIKSNDTGEKNAITFSAVNSGSTLLSDLGLSSSDNHLQTATDASFTYNGVSITRSSNTVEDLIVGAKITLNNAQADSTISTVSIKEDWTDLKKSINQFVTNYNSLMTNLDAATDYNADTAKKGSFQGVSQIVSFKSELNKQLLSIDSKGRSLADYGLALNDSGTLEFTESTFTTKVTSSASDVQDFFSGSTTYSSSAFSGESVSSGALNVTSGQFVLNGKKITLSTSSSATAADNATSLQKAINDSGITGIKVSVGSNNNIMISSENGIDITIAGDATALSSLGLKTTNITSKGTTNVGQFSSFKTLLNSYLNSTDGTLTLYSKYLETDKTSLTDERKKVVASLDSKYDTLYSRWSEYDSLISKLTTSFQSLSYMIQSSISSKS